MAHSPVPVAHVEPYRVRFDECGANGTLRTSTYLRYMQDAASVHSSMAGYTREWYREHGIFWLVRHVQLRVISPSRYGDVLAVSTEVVGFRRIWARRHSDVRDDGGRVVAEADVDWVLTDARGRPARIPEEISRRFAARLREGCRPGAVRLSSAPRDAHRRERTVEPSELDPLGHLNNAAYVDHLEAGLAEAGFDFATQLPRQVRMEYLVPAAAGDALLTETWRDGDSWWWRLGGDDGRAFARAVATGSPSVGAGGPEGQAATRRGQRRRGDPRPGRATCRTGSRQPRAATSG